MPAWTDRVLFKPSTPSHGGAGWGFPRVQLVSYESVREARHSDHRPVVATFDVELHPAEETGADQETAAGTEPDTQPESDADVPSTGER